VDLVDLVMELMVVLVVQHPLAQFRQVVAVAVLKAHLLLLAVLAVLFLVVVTLLGVLAKKVEKKVVKMP
jgi:hypothetical protein